MKTKIESKLILAFDYVLILAVDMSTRDYKELDGHLEDTLSERSRDQRNSCRSEIERFLAVRGRDC